MWILTLIPAACLILYTSILFIELEPNVQNFIKILPYITIANILYWHTFKSGQPFYIIWIVATGVTSILAVSMSIIVYNQHIEWKDIIGICLILIGSITLNIK